MAARGWRRLTLSQRLSLVFALLLLASSGVSAWLQVRAAMRQEDEVVQRLSRGLAAHIATHTVLVDGGRVQATAVHDLFDMLMVVNPSVEVYLLAPDGRLIGDAAPAGHLKRDRVDLGPVQRLLAGDALPIEGDDPRSASARKVFSAAPLRSGGVDAGYVYVVLQGEARDALSAAVGANAALRTTLVSMALVALCAVVAGLLAFRSITRRLRGVTAGVQRYASGGLGAVDPAAAPPPAASAAPADGDEIAVLDHAFAQMAARIAEQWRELVRQDAQRRELVANISHDLRTPLTSLHGYLETLAVKGGGLSDAERGRYLEIALAQSRKVGRLAQQLFELARLEHGGVTPVKERFSLAELVQDVFQKFELAAQARRLELSVDVAQGLPTVNADLGLIERVLTNLLDNAIRHTPEGGNIEVALRAESGAVAVEVADSGPGVPASLHGGLFVRPSILSDAPLDRGGLGLVIVQRILALHDSTIRLVRKPGRGAVFAFSLGAA